MPDVDDELRLIRPHLIGASRHAIHLLEYVKGVHGNKLLPSCTSSLRRVDPSFFVPRALRQVPIVLAESPFSNPFDPPI